MKILYLNHVCWEWIFQRPQILALLIEKDFDCTVVNKKFILGRTVARNNERPVSEKKVWLLPKANQIKVFRIINDYLYKNAVKKCADSADVIWVCHPLLYRFVPDDFQGKLIYDCMDNHVELTSEDSRVLLKNCENRLIEKADVIFATSQRLKEVVPGLGDAVLVRNGYRSAVPADPIKQAKIRDRYKIGYFGTISKWFDFSVLDASVKAELPVEYRLIGPVHVDIDKENKAFVFEGIVEHSELGNFVKDYDALIMPFQLNELILAVDPVKLYEYINFGKCIISVWYPELERFRPFVHFYKDEADYLELIQKLVAEGFPPKYSEEERKAFLSENSWEARYEVIREQLKKVE